MLMTFKHKLSERKTQNYILYNSIYTEFKTAQTNQWWWKSRQWLLLRKRERLVIKRIHKAGFSGAGDLVSSGIHTSVFS